MQYKVLNFSKKYAIFFDTYVIAVPDTGLKGCLCEKNCDLYRSDVAFHLLASSYRYNEGI